MMPNNLNTSPICIAGYNGWILTRYNIPSFQDQIGALFSSEFTSSSPHAVARDREIYRLPCHLPFGDIEVYLKRYYMTSRKQRIQTWLHVHKAQKSWRIGRMLIKKGILTPLPIAYFMRRASGKATEHVLITEGVSNSESLATYVSRTLMTNTAPQMSLLEKRNLIQCVAEFLGNLHISGIYHGDFTARNILVQKVPDSQCHIYLIDLDAVRSTHWISDQRRMKNLDELGRNFRDLKIFSTTDRGRFLKHYLKTNTKETRSFKHLFQTVLQRTLKRLSKEGRYFKHAPSTFRIPEFQYWNLEVAPRWKESFHDVGAVLKLLDQPMKIIQEHKRGVVKLVHVHETWFVVKQSKIQEHNRWAQFTSVYRKGEGARAFHNMNQLHQLGLPVPEPVLTLEKKRKGFVVASWNIYRYLEGRPCTCADAPLIATRLKEIHRHGWVHRDPHVKNFLLQGQHISLLDCVRARPWTSKYAQMYDVVLLDKCCPGSRQYYADDIETDWVYRLTKFHNRLIVRWRSLKRSIRSYFQPLRT